MTQNPQNAHHHRDAHPGGTMHNLINKIRWTWYRLTMTPEDFADFQAGYAAGLAVGYAEGYIQAIGEELESAERSGEL